MKNTLIPALMLAAMLAGCAGPKMGNIIPQASGVYSVVTSGASKNDALESALFSANATCKERNMRHIVTSQQTAYKGTLSESANDTMNKAAGLITAFTGNVIPTLSSNDDYQMTMNFTCEM